MMQNQANRPPEMEEYRSYSHYWEKVLAHVLPALPWIGAAFGLGYYARMMGW